MERLFDSKTPLFFSHRGGAGLFPENTLFAFQQSIERFKADVVELDVHMSKDGELVVIHDDTVNRTTNGTGLVHEKTLKELKALDAGWQFTADVGKSYPYRGRGLTIPALKEVFEALCHTGAGINIEVKRPYKNLENKLYNLIVGYSLTDRVLVVSGHSSVTSRFREINKRGIPTGADTAEGPRAFSLNLFHMGGLYRPKFDALQLPMVFRGKIRVVSEKLAAMCKSKGIKLHVWIRRHRIAHPLDELRERGLGVGEFRWRHACRRAMPAG
jgi:glycerophosphoryl diester phosphodiesterase